MTNPGANPITLASRIPNWESDLLPIAEAYRASRIEDPWHHYAYLAAEAVYRDRHPELPDNQVKRIVPRLIAAAAVEYGDWLYGD